MEASTHAQFLAGGEREITRRACVRYAAFLRRELELLPADHPMHDRYSRQLASLEPGLRPLRAPVP